MKTNTIGRLGEQGYEAFHWSGRDGTFNDLSVNKNNGTPIGSFDIVKSERGFSGWGHTGGLAIGNSAVLLPDMWTLCFWAKRPQASAITSVAFGWSGDANAWPCVGISWGTNRPIMYLGPNNYRYFNAPAVVDNSYHFWAFTIPGIAQADISSSVCYYDAASLGAFSTTATAAQTAKAYARVGATQNGVLRYDAFIDTVILYNGYNLNNTEVAQIMAETRPWG